ncbi:small cysteine and glycine repeat-containing protein 5 [Drosophila guanche]|uniref:small cysteine and glycine repeat-containing protein 5 n=1 Tax=Drosophila guanche TaxID=7266 RepID=UPI00147134F0|nr:small cysteine and glycine repeat-containing protein 5 [Drosophila guanche]
MCCNPGGCCGLPASIQCTNFCFNCWTGTASVPSCRTGYTPCCPLYRGCCGGPRGCC